MLLPEAARCLRIVSLLAAELHYQLTATLGDFATPASSEPAGGLSEEDEAALMAHLRDLGYL
jgi:hypothetical protein